MSNLKSRRTFLTVCTSVLMAAITLLLAIPVIGYVLAPFRRRQQTLGEGSMVDVGPLSDLPSGKWVLLPLEIVQQDGWEKARQRHSIYVRRTGNAKTDVIVLSPICSHLGCPINWDSDKSQFLCPCHGGIFDNAGKLAGGPPPRSMDPLDFDIRDGHLLVRWEDFKIGVSDRISVRV